MRVAPIAAATAAALISLEPVAVEVAGHSLETCESQRWCYFKSMGGAKSSEKTKGCIIRDIALNQRG